MHAHTQSKPPKCHIMPLIWVGTATENAALKSWPIPWCLRRCFWEASFEFISKFLITFFTLGCSVDCPFHEHQFSEALWIFWLCMVRNKLYKDCGSCSSSGKCWGDLCLQWCTNQPWDELTCFNRSRKTLFIIFIIFIYFWLCWVFIASPGPFSRCGKWGLLSSCRAWASHRRGFSGCRA